jgi:hypothetical protein
MGAGAVPMNVRQSLSEECKGGRKFSVAVSSVEVPNTETSAVVTLPTLFLEDSKQRWIRKSLRAYSLFIF